MPNTETIKLPNIVVESDYDHYFENLVREWCKRKAEAGGTFVHNAITISAGPYRSAAVSYESEPEISHLMLDFYSALRTGFGHLSQQDVADIIALL